MNPDANGGIAPPIAPPGEPIHWLVRPRTVRGLWIGFALILTGLVLGDFLVRGHPGFGIDGTFGFYAWYGLGTCVAMVLVAKALGLGLKRPDTYYGPGLEGGPGAGASAGEEAGGEGTAAAREGGSRTADPAGRQEKPAATAMEATEEAAAVEAAGSGRAAGERKAVEAAPEERAVAGESANAAGAADAAETKGAGGSGG